MGYLGESDYEELAIPVVDDWLQVVLVVSVDSKSSEDVLKKAIFIGKHIHW